MTAMLASVNCLAEALVALEAGVDIIDLKQPASGVLGALAIDTVSAIVDKIDHQTPVSATIGDLPMQPDVIVNAVNKMADTGVDFIKIGFFPGGDWLETIVKLAESDIQNLKLIAVLFADSQPDFSILSTIKKAGFTGVMLDTMDKHQGSLCNIMDIASIENFIHEARNQQLVCGLAGSLRLEDISDLQFLQADYLGFRGALCLQHNRVGKLDRDLLLKVKQAVHQQ